jgi:hypothetical protein
MQPSRPVLVRPAMAVAAACALLAACGGGGSASPGTTPDAAGTSATSTAPSAADVATAFPSGLAIASPTAMQATPIGTASAPSPLRLARIAAGDLVAALSRGERAAAGSALARLMPLSSAHAAASHTPAALVLGSRIDALLAGATPTRPVVRFDADRFLGAARHAGCYGPRLKFDNHPEGSASAGELPTGDLGLWSAIDAETGQACAAAALDARLDAIAWRTHTALMALAGFVDAARTAGKPLPASGRSLSLVAEMNAAHPGVTFTTASVSRDAAGAWTYTARFSFTDRGGQPRSAELVLAHTPGADRTRYDGLLTYAVTRGTTDLRNCPPSSGGTIDVGTLRYVRSGEAAMDVVVREGNYCGAGTPTALASSVADFAADGQLDPAAKWDGRRGWANDFSRFGASYAPRTLAGRYAFAWQAGHFDGHARLFNVGLNHDAASGRRDGEAWFGFGDDIASSTGTIRGFICNWAGPGARRTMQPYAQRQNLSFDDAAGRWTPTNNAAASSNLAYAPTNDCTYAGGAFRYDRNLDGTLDGTDPVVVATPDLMGRTVGPTTHATIGDAIAARGYAAPAF